MADDLTITRGKTWALNVTVYQSDGTTPYNLSTVSQITFNLKQSTTSTVAPLITKTLGSGITITSPTVGTFAVALIVADTLLLEAYKDYWFDIEMVDQGATIPLDTAAIGVAPRVATG